MSEVQETHINAYYAELAQAKAAVVTAQGRVDELEELIAAKEAPVDETPVEEATEASDNPPTADEAEAEQVAADVPEEPKKVSRLKRVLGKKGKK